jgi:hypothetical protein
MRWLFSAALLPLVLCGGMCIGGALLAALGLRRGTSQRSGPPPAETASRPPQEALDR